MYAFATRAHPGQGAFQYPQQLTSPMPVFLDDSERTSFLTTKIIHNCLLTDRYPPGRGPVVGNLANAWPPEIGRRAIEHWRAHGYR